MPGFIEQRKQLSEAGVQQRMMEEKIYPLLYTHILSYAMEYSRVDDYLDSRKLNFDCMYNSWNMMGGSPSGISSAEKGNWWWRI